MSQEAEYHERVRNEFIVDGYNLPQLTEEEVASFPVIPWPKNPVFVKPQYAMFRTRFIAADQFWKTNERTKGKYVAVGYCINQDGHINPNSTRTSLIVDMDIELGYFETMNSIYWMK